MTKTEVKRIRVQTALDKDTASPDSISASQAYMTGSMFEKAESLGVAIDWDTFRCYARKNADGDLVLTQWAKVIR